MVSIVGFGRPKFKGAVKTSEITTNKTDKPKPTKVKTCPTCQQEIK